MVAISETNQPIPEPELPQIDVSVNASEIMATLEASLIKIPAIKRELANNGIKNELPDSLAFEHNDMYVHFLRESERDAESDSKRMSVVIWHTDPKDHTQLLISKLNLFRCSVDRYPQMPTGKVETNLNGVRSKNTQTALQNAQHFIALLS